MEPVQEKKEYYEHFEDYIDKTYKERTSQQYIIRFDLVIKKWFMYGIDKYYKDIPIQKIYEIFKDVCFWRNIKGSTSKLNYCVKMLESQVSFNGAWIDQDPELDNCINGIVDIKTGTKSRHDVSLMFRHQVPRKFIIDIDPVIPEKFDILLKCIPNKTHRDNFLKFFLNVVHKRFDDEVFLILYGPKGAGKSTIIQIFTEMYGPDLTSKTELHKFGKRFGLSSLYDKRLNANPDLPIIDLYPSTIAELKRLTGEDGYLEVELKNRDTFKYPISCFLVFGMNQLPGFSQNAEKEVDSIMRRAVLVECPNLMPKDADFKKSIRDPEFLDELYSWAIITKPIPMYEPEEEEEWIRQNKENWLLSSDPILRILQGEYEYCATDMVESDEGIQIPITQSIRVSEVREVVEETLKDEGSIVPKHTSIQSLITQAFKTMKVYKNNGRGKNAAYENIVRRDSE